MNGLKGINFIEVDESDIRRAKSKEDFVLNLLERLMSCQEEEEREEKEDQKHDTNMEGISFVEMIHQLDNKTNKKYTDGDMVYSYDYDSKTLLVESECGRFPASITARLVNGRFYEVNNLISREEALSRCTSGETVKFTVDLYGRTYTGHLTVRKGIPSYKINNADEVIGSHENVILGALLLGQWSL